MFTYKHLPEESLLELVHKSNEKAIAELLNRYKSRFYTAVYLLVKDRYVAEDIFQDASIKIIQSIRAGKYNDSGKFLPWALRIARNLSIDYLRTCKRMPKVSLPDGQDVFSVLDFGQDNAEDTIINSQSQGRVRKMLEFIPYEQREVIVMRLFGDLSFKEIADMTNVSINTALGRMRYGLLNLRKMMEEKQLSL
ncbi:MAG TPA: sigma-70 family RNA polymerase sigma factor [Chitinophagaceae bacterium]|nr:sigma-70 family RNA polymerase sigma factor [Chitinophagaceae bacterium]